MSHFSKNLSNPQSILPSLIQSLSPTLVPSLLGTSDIVSSEPSIVDIISPRPSTAPINTSLPTPTFVPSFVTSQNPSNSSDSQMPTNEPSILPSNHQPSNVPTRSPTALSSNSPSDVPSTFPTTTSSTSPSNHPSSLSTAFPSTTPSTSYPSAAPTLSAFPSVSPSASLNPSFSPSVSDLPSLRPTSTKIPSSQPSIHFPSVFPSHKPSISIKPSSEPTITESLSALGVFTQEFRRRDNAEFADAQITSFSLVYEKFTKEYGEGVPRVKTSCRIKQQKLDEEEGSTGRSGELQDGLIFVLTVNYEMKYTTRYDDVEVEDYPLNFMMFMNNQTNNILGTVQKNLQSEGITIFNVSEVKQVTQPPSIQPTSGPSLLPSPIPSATSSTSSPSSQTLLPSHFPVSEAPTETPSKPPSNSPSQSPTQISSSEPTLKHSPNPSSVPSLPPPGFNFLNLPIWIWIAAPSALLVLLIFVCIICRRRIKKCCCDPRKKPVFTNESNLENHPDDFQIDSSSESMESNISVPDQILQKTFPVPSSGSVGSHSSLLSAGSSNISIDSIEAIHSESVLEIEFEAIKRDIINGESSVLSRKHEPLEKPDFFTLAGDYTWGGSKNPYEVEATALYKTSDWKKRQQGASESEKRAYMQQNIQTMILSVENNIIAPSDGSRIIHECCALLGLPLQEEIPKTSLIVTGMVKTATSEDLMDGFIEFGDIEGIAVAGGEKGFGIVRYKSPKSVLRALEKFRTEEIIVQDVAVVIKMLEFEPDYRSEGSQSGHNSPRQPNERTVVGGLRRETSPSNHINLDIIGYPHGSLGRHGVS